MACRISVPSNAPKKWVRFLTTGPPNEKPNWFWASLGFWAPGSLANVLKASSFSLRRNSQRVPWKLLVPDLVTIRTCNACRPFSAPKFEVSTLNSAIVFHVGDAGASLVERLIGGEPIDLKLGAIAPVAVSLHGRLPVGRSSAYEANARHQVDHLDRIAAIQRQISDLLLRDHSIDRAPFRLDQLRAGLNVHTLNNFPDLEPGLEPSAFADR